MSSAATFWTGVLLVAVGAYGGYTFWKISKMQQDRSTEPAVVAQDDTKVGEFTLTTQTGAKFDSKSLQGKVWVGSLFFSLCPSECKLQNTAIAQLQKQLAGEDLTWVSITCAPEMDTPAVLTEYAKRFDADPRTWKFLTGSMDTIRRVATKYFKVPFGPQTHSSRLVLIDREGTVVGRYDVFSQSAVERFKEEVKKLTSGETPAKG
ncbi:MAG: SCO family protein [Pirellulales bacterium]|nr:SCO family protein [Pirellulales bacterium]